VPALHSSFRFANYKTEHNTSDTERFMMFSKNGNSSLRSNVTEYENVRSQCEHLCDRGVSCLQELFEPFVIAEQESLLPNTQYFDVQVFAPKYVIEFKYEPKTPVIHFICYVGSTTNLWLGISFLAMLKFAHKYTSDRMRKRRDAKRKRHAAKKGELEGPEAAVYDKAASAVRESQYKNTYSQPGQFDAW
jgi:hypothetical protein